MDAQILFTEVGEELPIWLEGQTGQPEVVDWTHFKRASKTCQEKEGSPRSLPESILTMGVPLHRGDPTGSIKSLTRPIAKDR